MPESDTLTLKDRSLLVESCLIGGEWSKAGAGTIDVTNPATGAVIARVPNAGAEETARAIKAAHAAYPAWRAKTANERAVLLRKLAALVTENQEDLAQILTAEQGKSLTESRGEVAMSAAYVLWFAEEARRVYGDVIPSPWGDRKILVTKEPVGVVAAITPWNFPSSMIARKIAPALAAGCPIVIKPASQTPLSGLAWGVLCEKAGFPAGTVSILTGSARAIGGEMTGNPLVKKITFTGSTEVGKVLLEQASHTVKKVSMELGGNAPFIVFDDADLDRAVAGAMLAKYRNSGQTCICTNRFLVQDGIYDAFADKMAEAANRLKVGNGIEDGVAQGPLIDMAAVEKTEAHIRDAVEKGGRVVAGGHRHALGGQFFEPTVITGATPDMAVAREETFGPLAPLFRFRDEAEAIRMANDTEFGLACYFYTRDLGRTFRVAEALEYGMVGINEGIITTEVAPFGGVKESGLGREGSYQGIEDYLNTKYLCVGGLGA
ncbi:NAD-dependent succinate-semialdehyde dehydrogenase [Methylobacterium brachiatum]|uniref:NAD-dependent succinate-semialdehyde dehydrogenase n=1 Tax=Methylobacterium brachiatum TaxID=269660 RepID=UPI000EFAE7E7|nr:NAD-dependent succinate-semialdehyde dehydrogenase [Methylobacterium brachiatum]AYO82559.1 NAD-dependent succinate-semialdehyde dehydrogenase [Methylobacterium brachiatum]